MNVNMNTFDPNLEFGRNSNGLDYQFVDDGNLVIVREKDGKWSTPLWSSADGFLYKGINYQWNEFEDMYEDEKRDYKVDDVYPLKNASTLDTEGIVEAVQGGIKDGKIKIYSYKEIMAMQDLYKSCANE